MRGRVVGAVALVGAVAVVLALVGARTGPREAPAPAAPGDLAAQPTPDATPAPGRLRGVLPPVEGALLREERRQAEQRLLRERLGGLATLAGLAPPGELAACVPDGLDRRDEPATTAGVASVTEDLRGLELTEEVTTELLPPHEMVRRVEEAFGARADPDTLALERRILLALGAVTPDVDLRHARLDAFAEQVSGLFSGARGEVLVRVEDPERLSPLERVVLAHEYEHALTHQALGRPSQARERGEDADQRRASQAVVEGSATLAMLHYAHAALDETERVELRRELLARAREGGLEGFTPYLVSELQYPYTEGLVLACSRFAEGGWAAVDALYADPPDSSLAVLLPDRFAAASPVPPPVLNRPGGGWRQVAADAFGAADLLWLLEAPNADPGAALDAPRERVAAWQGGRLVAWSGDGGTVVGLSLAQREGEESLCETTLAWQEAGWDADRSVRPGVAERDGTQAASTHLFEGPGRVAVIACDRDGVRVAIAGDRAEALAVVGATEISSILGMTAYP